MVVIDIEVNGEKKTVYMDNKLKHQLDTKLNPRINKKDFDWVWIVDGSEGSGKSTFAQQIAKVLDPTFCIERMCMTPNEFTKAILKANKGQCVIFDEAFTGLSSRASLTEINKLLVSLMMEMRQKNLIVIVVMPTIFLLDKYVALFRSRGLFHVYLKNGRRGQWIYFNNKKKKLLYLLGKKLYDYSKPRSGFRGRFLDQYTIDEAEYRKKKGWALMNKSRGTKAEVYKDQRDTLFWILYKKLKINYSKISKMCKDEGYKVDRTTIYDVILSKEKEKIQKEIIEEEKNEISKEDIPKDRNIYSVGGLKPKNMAV